VALSDYLTEGELIEDFLMDMGTMMNEDLVMNVHLVFQDNQHAIALVKGDGGNMRSKYLKVRREYVKERLGTGEVEIEVKPTGQMIADVLTKPLGGVQYHILVENPIGKTPLRFIFEQQGGEGDCARQAANVRWQDCLAKTMKRSRRRTMLMAPRVASSVLISESAHVLVSTDVERIDVRGTPLRHEA